MVGFLLQWPIPTLVMFPILVVVYGRLAAAEERDVRQRFGSAWDEYAAHTRRFIPGWHQPFWRTMGAEHRLATSAEAEFVVRKSLALGAYSVLTYERPCEGACPEPGQVGALDRPTSRCQRTLSIESGETSRLPGVSGPGVDECPTY